MKEEEIDLNDSLKNIKRFINSISREHYVIIILMALIWLMYLLHTNDIAACNNFYNIVPNKTTNFIYDISLNLTR